MVADDRRGQKESDEGDLPGSVRCREFLRIVQRLTETGIWSYEPTTGETWWSERARELCGIGEGEAPSFPEVVSRRTEADRSALGDAFAEAVEDRKPFDVRAEFDPEDAARRTVRVRCEPRETGDDAAVLLGVVQDVTDETRKEQRIEVLRRTGQRLERADSRGAVAGILADASKNILGLVNTTIRLTDGNDDTLRTVVATEECVERAGERPDYSVDEETPAARTYRSGEPELHSNHELTDDEYDRGELRSGLYVPIGDHGVLSAGDVVVDGFDEQDLEAAGLLGQLGAEALTRIGLTRRSRAI